MYYNTELYHHGILGQKWGVRRYQNPDGTLTAAGRKHVAKTFQTSYNNANKTMNQKLPTINENYKDDELGWQFETKKGQQYIKEINKTWQDTYTSELQKQYGREMTSGEAWIKEAPFMDMYTSFIKD